MAPASQPEWHFEFSGGVPSKLVWQTQAGHSYDLQFTMDLAGWYQVSGFPKIGSGAPMEYPFTPGARGFFKITSSPSTDPTGVFFSEYVEGSGINKALEIFNGTAAAIDLGAGVWDIQIFHNGSPSPGVTIALSGVVNAGDVFVMAHTFASSELVGLADHSDPSVDFNGDDAIVLRRNGVVIDVIGQVGNDPGSEWGSGAVSTADNTMRRKAGVVAGDPEGADPFNPADEWDGWPVDTFSGLGTHGGP